MSIKPRDTDKVLKCHISVNSYSSFFIVKIWWINVKPESKLKPIWVFSVVKIFNRKRLFGLKCIFWQPSNFSRLQPILFFRFHIFVFFWYWHFSVLLYRKLVLKKKAIEKDDFGSIFVFGMTLMWMLDAQCSHWSHGSLNINRSPFL